MLAFVGIPMMLMEMSFGQYCSQGVLTMWNAIPCMRGVGYGILIVVTISRMSSMLITAYSFYYLFASFQKTLPWTGCHNDWNTIYCSELLNECIDQSGIIVGNGSCVLTSSMTSSELVDYGIHQLPSGVYDLSNYTDPLMGQRLRASEEYW
ncbi:amino acid transporter, partial [Apostichopus japonicus]